MSRMPSFWPGLVAAVAACAPAASPGREAAYVGSAACGECHAAAVQLVAGRAHQLAMRPAADSGVAGRFDGARLVHFASPSEFFERAGTRYVRTAGEDGRIGEYPVAYVLGLAPLEQFLAAGRGGRFQVLPFAWDTRSAGEGGGRWFHVYPGQAIPPGDELHWTGPLQTWNYMCAECHVTGVVRGYDLATDAYRTSWRELGVQCEACHGPGSAHVAWARRFARDSVKARASDAAGTAGFALDLGTKQGTWVRDSGEAIAHRTKRLPWNAQAETCAACHARRETLVADRVPGRPLLATHRPELLAEGLYYADGQIEDEVYEYGSFLQTRMYRAGVTCSDCHHPSTQEVPPGNLACAKCHDPRVYDTPAHHFHQPDSAGGSCVGCHMLPRTYMVVDVRHDHSIRVPRPDLSVRIGSPNACTACHTDRSDAWAASAILRWYGPPQPARHYGDVIAAGRRALPAADTALVRLAADTAEAGIVRATAVSLLDRYPTAAATAALERAARDPEPLVRLAAAMAGGWLAPETRQAALAPLLADSLLAIRVEAVRALADVPEQALTSAQRAAFAEFVTAQQVNADQPESHLALGVLHVRRGQIAAAEQHYRNAIRIAPRHIGGYLNLADLYRAQGRDADGERVLREGLRTVHQPAALHHSLGLLLVRQGALDQALPELGRAVALEPGVARFAQVYGIALRTAGRTAEARHVLEEALRRSPSDPALAEALAALPRR